MSKILAIAVLSLAGAATAQATGWVADPHYGKTLPADFNVQTNDGSQTDDSTPPINNLNQGCQSDCGNNGDQGDPPGDPPGNDPPAVPEPGTSALFAAGMLLGGIYLSRRPLKPRRD